MESMDVVEEEADRTSPSKESESVLEAKNAIDADTDVDTDEKMDDDLETENGSVNSLRVSTAIFDEASAPEIVSVEPNAPDSPASEIVPVEPNASDSPASEIVPVEPNTPDSPASEIIALEPPVSETPAPEIIALESPVPETHSPEIIALDSPGSESETTAIDEPPALETPVFSLAQIIASQNDNDEDNNLPNDSDTASSEATDNGTSSKKLVKCDLCPRQFQYPSQCKQHRNSVHFKSLPKSFRNINTGQKSLITCDLCPRKFVYPSQYKQHRNTSHSKAPPLKIHEVETNHPFKCPQCSWTFVSVIGLKKHLRYTHKRKGVDNTDKEYKCQMCLRNYYSQSVLEHHINTKHSAFPCPVCSSSFKIEQLLARHVHFNHKNHQHLLFICDIDQCSQYYIRKNTLTQHLEEKHGILHYCDKCSTSFTTKFELEQHLETPVRIKKEKDAHNENEDEFDNVTHVFKCDICEEDNLTFPTQCSLNSHKKLHPKESNFSEIEQNGNRSVGYRRQCDICSKIFRNEQSYEDHVANHAMEDEKPYKCDDCSESFDTNRGLICHKRHVHSTKDRLKKSWTWNARMKRREYSYVRTDTTKEMDAFGWVCDVCFKSFDSEDPMTLHMGVHHGRFFYCDKCTKSYTIKSVYDRHLGVSSGLDPDPHCGICNESFENQCSLCLHHQIHLKEFGPGPEPTITFQNGIKITCDTGFNFFGSKRKQYKCDVCSRAFSEESHHVDHRKLAHPNDKWHCDLCDMKFFDYCKLKYHVKHHDSYES